jgi:methylated-DNA-[protein]-cysteine S-methyltransferase
VVAVTPHRDAVRHPDTIRYRYAVAGWGVGEIAVRDGMLLSHSLPSRRRTLSPRAGGPQGGASTPEVRVSAGKSQPGDTFASDLCRRFAAHLVGTPVSYDDVEVEERGLSPFQRDLLAAARSIAWGDVVTYGGLASLAGRPRAARATGSFCAGNRLSLVVPCHRVVAAGREEPYQLGAYGPSGAPLKRRLLALEGTLL